MAAIKLRFFNRRMFEGDYYERAVDGDQTYYKVKRRLEQGGRARGSITIIEDPFDPPGAPYAADCWTSIPPLRWTASKR